MRCGAWQRGWRRLRDWQKGIIRDIYDPRDGEGRRLVRTALITMPRKNGKTGLAAPLVLAHLCGPEAVPRGQIYSAAADRKQTALIFAEIKAILNAVPALGEQCNIQRFAKKIEHLANGTIYRPLSSEANIKHGLSASLIVYDELAQAPNRALYDVLQTSQSAWDETGLA